MGKPPPVVMASMRSTKADGNRGTVMTELDLYRSLAHLREVQCDAIDAGRIDFARAIEAAIDVIRPDIRTALDMHVDRDE